MDLWGSEQRQAHRGLPNCPCCFQKGGPRSVWNNCLMGGNGGSDGKRSGGRGQPGAQGPVQPWGLSPAAAFAHKLPQRLGKVVQGTLFRKPPQN